MDGEPMIDEVAFDLRDCVEDALTLQAPAAFGKSLDLIHFIYDDVPLKLYGDPLRVRQVLVNLIHNAIRFTARGQIVVRIMLERESGFTVYLRATVSDTGVGLDARQRARLSAALQQTDTSTARRQDGSGLGLILCAKLVKQMGGEIGLESKPKRGSTFWFTLRCTRQSGYGAQEQWPTPNPLAGRQVLLGDDSTLSRRAFRHALESMGMQVTEAADSRTFTRYLDETGRWDLALWGLSRQAAKAAQFHAIAQCAGNTATPLVVLTGTVNQNALQALARQGARCALPGSVRRKTLYRELCHVLPRGDTTPPGTRPARQTVKTGQQRIRALLVDDDSIHRKLLTNVLARHGIHADEAGDGRQAVNLAQKTHYHIVFMDEQMPAMSGHAAAARIHRQQAAHGAAGRIVILTANAGPAERERLRPERWGPRLLKPLSERQVLEEIRLAIRGLPLQLPRESSRENSRAGELLALLRTELPDHARAIRSAFDRCRLAELRNHVHRLHGAAGVCRLTGLRNACKALEDRLSAGGKDGSTVQDDVERVLGEIRRLLASLPQEPQTPVRNPPRP